MVHIWTEREKTLAQQELVFRKCAVDKIFFFNNFWHIKHPKGSRLFEPRQPQLDVADIWGAGKDSITLKARQIGWSTLVGADTFWEGYFKPEYEALLLSKGEREAVKLLGMLKYGYRRLPDWMKSRGPELLDANQSKMTFSSDTQIQSLPSANDPARGYTGNRVIGDEFAFLTNDVESWAAIEPVTDIGGQLIILSTANGFGNLFHELWVRAELGESSMTPSFYGWWAVPERDQAWYEAKAASMPGWQLAQEYPDNPEEAFIKSGNLVFDYDIISQMTAAEPKWVGDMVDGQFVEMDGGPLAVWEKPEAGQDYVISADTAEGLEYGDYSSSDVLTPEGVQVAHWHGKRDPDLWGKTVSDLGRWYNYGLAIPEANSIGLATITTMRNNDYGRIWRRQQVNTTSSGFTAQLGFLTTRNTKPQIISDLAGSLRSGMVIRSQRTIKELHQYVRDSKGGTQGSPHDDAVMSLALANHARPYVFADEYKPEDLLIPGSWDYEWKRLQAHQGASDSGRRIGSWNEKRSPVS